MVFQECKTEYSPPLYRSFSMFENLRLTRGLAAKSWLLLAALMWLLAGCERQQQWGLHDITDHLPDLQFSLISDAGQPVTNDTLQGYLVMLFFGFTHCRDVCPVTLSRLTALLPRLGDSAKNVRIVFVTLDPERDTTAVLHRYVTAYDPKLLIGVTGSREKIEDLAKRYRIAYRPVESGSDDIPHSAAVYVFDRRLCYQR